MSRDPKPEAWGPKPWLYSLFAFRQINVSSLISHAFSLDQIEQSMDYATTYKDNARKVCLKF